MKTISRKKSKPSDKKVKRRDKMRQAVCDIYGMLMVLLVEVESKRFRENPLEYHWEEIEADAIKYSTAKEDEFLKLEKSN